MVPLSAQKMAERSLLLLTNEWRKQSITYDVERKNPVKKLLLDCHSLKNAIIYICVKLGI